MHSIVGKMLIVKDVIKPYWLKHSRCPSIPQNDFFHIYISSPYFFYVLKHLFAKNKMNEYHENVAC